MDEIVEQVLIVYSVEKTPSEDIEAATAAIGGFRPDRRAGRTRVEARVFQIPTAASPGHTLGTELSAALNESIGALVFVDDLRPNISYELGYMHGRGRSVLLLTRRRIDEIWLSISDLAGAALVALDQIDLAAAVNQYLNRLYTEELPRTPVTPLLSLPSAASNHLNELNLPADRSTTGPYGSALRAMTYEPPTDIAVGVNLLPNARLSYLVKSDDEHGDFAFYARVRFKDRRGRRRRVWLGATSLRRDGYITRFERLIPIGSPTTKWQLLVLELTELLQRGFLLGADPPDFLETLRFRVGARDRRSITPVEIGHVGLVGIDGNLPLQGSGQIDL